MVQPEREVQVLPEPTALGFGDCQKDAVSEVGAPSLPPIITQDIEMADIPTADALPNAKGSAPEFPKAGKQPWAMRMLKRKARLACIAQIISWTKDTGERMVQRHRLAFADSCSHLDNVTAEELMQKVRTNGMQVSATEPISEYFSSDSPRWNTDRAGAAFTAAIPWSRAKDDTHGKEDAEGTRGVTIQIAMQQAIDGFEREAENCLQLL